MHTLRMREVEGGCAVGPLIVVQQASHVCRLVVQGLQGLCQGVAMGAGKVWLHGPLIACQAKRTEGEPWGFCATTVGTLDHSRPYLQVCWVMWGQQ